MRRTDSKPFQFMKFNSFKNSALNILIIWVGLRLLAAGAAMIGLSRNSNLCNCGSKGSSAQANLTATNSRFKKYALPEGTEMPVVVRKSVALYTAKAA